MIIINNTDQLRHSGNPSGSSKSLISDISEPDKKHGKNLSLLLSRKKKKKNRCVHFKNGMHTETLRKKS